MRLIGLVQVRDGSTRLPGKALLDVNGLPILQHILNRLHACTQLDGLVVSTSVDSPDVSKYCKRFGVNHYVGSELDLLSRHMSACIVNDADAFVRVTGDELFMDPAVVDDMAAAFRGVMERRPNGLLMSNWYMDRTISEGLDLTACSVSLMKQLAEDDECDREDWITYAHKRDQEYVVWSRNVHFDDDLGKDLHLSIDTETDLARARGMMRWLGNARWDYRSTLKAYEATK